MEIGQTVYAIFQREGKGWKYVQHSLVSDVSARAAAHIPNSRVEAVKIRSL